MANGKRQMDENKRLFHFPFSIFHLPLLVALLAGCTSEQKPGPTTKPAGVKDRQEAALRDPMGYSPNMNSPDTDISGGKLHELDRGALKKDIDHVLNP
jgi:hypothetical protein